MMEQESPTRMATTSNHSTHAPTHTHTPAHTHPHTRPHTRTHTHTHALAHTPTHMHQHTRPHARTRTHAHTHAPGHTPTRTHQHTRPHARTSTHAHTHAHTHAPGHTPTPPLCPGACWDLPEPPLCKCPSGSLDLTVVSSVGLFPLTVQGKLGPARNHSAGNRRLENRRDVSTTGSCRRNGHTSPTSAAAPSPPRNRKLSLPQSAGL